MQRWDWGKRGRGWFWMRGDTALTVSLALANQERGKEQDLKRIVGRGRQILMLQSHFISPMRRVYGGNFPDGDSSQSHSITKKKEIAVLRWWTLFGRL
jgi:hypothetical protein